VCSCDVADCADAGRQLQAVRGVEESEARLSVFGQVSSRVGDKLCSTADSAS
jgi:hypothetical protein